MINALNKALPVYAVAIAGFSLMACTGTSPDSGESLAEASGHHMELPELSEAEREQIQAESRKPDREPLRTGIPRDLDIARATMPLEALRWREEGDRETAVISIRSPEARGMRLGLDLETDDCPLSFRFTDSGDASGETFSAATVSNAKPLWWSPITRGETAHMHLSRPSGAGLDACELKVPQISHLF